MPDTKTVDPSLVSQIVSGYVTHNTISASELPNLIATVHRSLAELGTPAPAPAPAPKAAVAISRSYGNDFVVCLDCGWRGQMLRRHLTTRHALSPREYRGKWGLKDSHPLTAPAYTKRRSTIARELGLGRSLLPASAPASEAAPPVAAPAESALDPAFVTSLSQPKRRGRPRRTAPSS